MIGDRMRTYDDPPLFEMDVAEWVNAEAIDLAELRGRIVVVETFQMLCPGCVSHGIPQAQRVRQAFPVSEVVVLGLHTVFEHHEVMGPDALRVFLSEYRINFPVAVDLPSTDDRIPTTMGRYQLQGTPSTLLVDRDGRLRHTIFGAADDLVLGALIGELAAEPAP